MRLLAFSLEVPVSHTQIAVLNPPVMTSLGLGQIAHRICPHSDRHSYTTTAYETKTTHEHTTIDTENEIHKIKQKHKLKICCLNKLKRKVKITFQKYVKVSSTPVFNIIMTIFFFFLSTKHRMFTEVYEYVPL